jgi:subtilisin-like proprotein convertase family protein
VPSEEGAEAGSHATPPSPLVSLVGQGVAGAWVLRVGDLAGRDVGTLVHWKLEVQTAA